MIAQTGYHNTVKPFEINHNTVYIRSNIHESVDSEGCPVWEYNERQLTVLEYLKEAFPENQVTTDQAIAELMLLFNAYQEQMDAAIAELSVLIGGLTNNV